MVIAKGVSIGPYEILSPLGAGGMGEVWRARDNRIRRDVAVKVLPDAVKPGDGRLERFEQEARAAGGLNHPGLVTIFDVGNVDGVPYIVMELLEGQSLRELLGEPIPVRKVIDYAIQIASALAVAHERGIVHRDLKPENLFLTSDRRVKILDFGLAKLAPEPAAAAEVDENRRTAKHLTSAGTIVGTPGYMSPEQLRAQAIDHRTDIFSFGLILYEMLTGHHAFERRTAIETMHAILREESPAVDVPNISPALEGIVRHCMEKEPRDRFQSARDLAFHLRMLPELQNSGTLNRPVVQPAVQPVARRPYRAGIIALTLLLLGAAGALVLRALPGSSSAPAPRRYKQLTADDGLEIFPSLAPDGKSLAYVSDRAGNRDIYVQRVDGRTAINITADWTGDETEPAFSPDGSQIAFRSERDGGGIFVMGATGESPVRLTDFGHNPTWSPDGTQIAFATEVTELKPSFRPRFSELWVVNSRTGVKRALLQPRKGGADFGSHSDAVQPSWSPNGKRIAFWSASISGQRDIWTIDPHAKEPKKTAVRVTSDPALHWNPVWSPDGGYLYYGSDADGTLSLWRVPMNQNTGAPTGVPEPVGLPAATSGNFAFAKTGELAYVSVTSSYRVLAMPFDVNAGTVGAPRRLLGGSQEILVYEPSPDGKMIAYATSGAQEDLFVSDGARIHQLTNDTARDRGVQWSPGGKMLYFHSNRDGAYRIWSVRVDGSDLRRVTTDADAKALGVGMFHSPVPSPDGQKLLVQADPDRQKIALIHLDRPAGQRVEPLPVYLPSPKWSPDGRYLVSRDQREPDAQRATPNDPPGSILLYSLQTKQVERLANTGFAAHWSADGAKVVYFEREDIRIYDMKTRTQRIVPFTPASGEEIDLRNFPRLSRDAATLCVQQAIEQGDIWMVRFPVE
jgi:eukaryotic-like serine/threonine-protein kinase